MIKQYRGADRAINYLFENAKEVSIQRYLTTGTLIATLSIDGTTFDLYSAGGDNVTWNQLSISGTKIAQISINGTITDIYAPTAGGATALSGLSDVNLFSPTDGQILKYDATNQVWINANESGGSSTLDGLSDVSITTPTDGQVLAYDATSGEWVNSNAGGGGGTLIEPVIYSTTEREVGVWVDGKPLYQKTIEITSFPSTVGTFVDYPHNIADIDKICTWEGEIRFSDGMVGMIDVASLANSSTINLGGMTHAYVTKTNIRIIVGMDRSAASGEFTIRYTKTTDTAGSGTWTPSGIPTHHYSTDEQIVGTWIDGKTIYQKSVDFGALPNNTSKSVAHNITGLDEFVKVEKIYKSTAGYWYDEILAQSSLNNIVSMNVDSTNINISTGNNFTSISCIVTMWYTKT